MLAYEVSMGKKATIGGKRHTHKVKGHLPVWDIISIKSLTA